MYVGESMKVLRDIKLVVTAGGLDDVQDSHE